MAGHVFVSYSRHDAAYVTRLVAHLTECGLSVWADAQIPTGERWDRTLRDKIDGCAAFVLVMSPAAEDSEWVAEEIDRARSKGRPILPLLLAGGVFFGFSRTQYDDVTGGRMPGEEFVARLRVHAGATAAPVATDEVPRGPVMSVTRDPLRRLDGHADAVAAVAFSADGRQLASAGHDGTVRLWPVTPGGDEGPRVLSSDGKPLWTVAYAPDGHTVASGGSGGALIWDAFAGQPLLTLNGHTDAVRTLAYHPDGRVLATGGDDGIVCLWSMDSGERLDTLTAVIRRVFSVAWSPDGRSLAVGDAERAQLWHTSPQGRSPAGVLPGATQSVTSLSWAPDGDHLATGGDDGFVRIWRIPAGELLNTTNAHAGRVYSVAYSPDGRSLAAGGLNGEVRVWYTRDGALAHVLAGHRGRVFSVAWSPDGRLLATASGDRSVHLWDLTGSPGRAQPTAAGVIRRRGRSDR